MTIDSHQISVLRHIAFYAVDALLFAAGLWSVFTTKTRMQNIQQDYEESWWANAILRNTIRGYMTTRWHIWLHRLGGVFLVAISLAMFAMAYLNVIDLDGETFLF